MLSLLDVARIIAVALFAGVVRNEATADFPFRDEEMEEQRGLVSCLCSLKTLDEVRDWAVSVIDSPGPSVNPGEVVSREGTTLEVSSKVLRDLPGSPGQWGCTLAPQKKRAKCFR